MDNSVTAVEGLTVRPLEDARFGATIAGVDPGRITPAQKQAILEASYRRSGLLCFEFDRLLTADELHELTAVFGKNEFAPGRINGIGKKATASERHLTVEQQVAALRADGIDPYITYLGNVDPKTLKLKPVNAKFFGEWEWHTDMSYIEVPPTFSILHARQIPSTGGDTGFASQVLAAKALPKALRERVHDLWIKHDSTYGSSGIIRPGMTPPESPIEALGQPHPVLRRIPGGDEEALFLGRRTNAYVLGLPLDESEALLDELWAFATQPEFQYRHKWQAGQVIVWDNRMLMHMRHPVDDSEIRFMWRTQTKGEAVVPAGRRPSRC